ncbi:hypothetical protein SPACI_021700 [Sporomusa acidovorans DSM 3132]|uniref:Transposase n=1 Tax=Sporomusa acidovorans (strain ATCC 49682 / DSM 3132 / Mol) TaxID=1123286 RepID=A0ABZ3J180_SPOA4|nr:hypothetical protein [Sporomusa acidovorans]OZC13657.1 hypothetical protein SPACI_56380 [Sporomusa acidovorans DSM 3132]SDE85947.1 putative transposase [Sporomusa acidovorans]
MNKLESQIQDVTNAMKSTKNRRMFERYQAVKLYLEGHKIIHIAKIINKDPRM